jgi:hypothetical protein
MKGDDLTRAAAPQERQKTLSRSRADPAGSHGKDGNNQV